jgi:pyridoxamine 5'-phosphate oxidase family protein
VFTENEIAYLRSQHVARIATVSADGQPDVMPVGFEFDGEVFYVGGHSPTDTRKYRNVRAGNTHVALVVDDLVTVDPWHPRGIRMYGTAEFVEREGQFGPGVYMRIAPRVSWSWSVEKPAFGEGGWDVNKIVHDTPES